MESNQEGKSSNPFTLVLDVPTPSLNQFTYAKSIFVQSNEKKRWYWIIRAAPGFLAIPKATGKRRVVVERHSHQALDYDNLVGGLKRCVIDNLCKLGLLVDDKPSLMDLQASNVKLEKGRKAHTILRFIDL